MRLCWCAQLNQGTPREHHKHTFCFRMRFARFAALLNLFHSNKLEACLHSGLGCGCNMKVCVLGAEPMLGQHILLFKFGPYLSHCDHPIISSTTFLPTFFFNLFFPLGDIYAPSNPVTWCIFFFLPLPALSAPKHWRALSSLKLWCNLGKTSFS